MDDGQAPGEVPHPRFGAVNAAVDREERPHGRRLLIIGGGMAGMTAAVEAVAAGCEVVLLEREPYLGGRVAQMHQYFPKLCPPACGMELNLRRIRTSPRITVHTQAMVVAVSGEPGAFHATVRQAPRFVAERCAACGKCAEVCPAERPSAFDFGMRTTRAAYLAYPGAWPARYTIDRAACGGTPHPGPLPAARGEGREAPHPTPLPAARGEGIPLSASPPRGEAGARSATGEGTPLFPPRGEAGARSATGEGAPPCTLCASSCPNHAIDLAAAPRTFVVDADAIVWATGWQPYEATRLTDLAFGRHPNVITNMMLERLASPHGPTAGKILCPSDGRAPATVAFVQCAGSRDDAHLPYCSGLCCLATAKHARNLRAQHPEADITVYYIDRRATGRHETFLAETERDARVHYVPGKVARISTAGQRPVLEVEDTARAVKLKHEVDLVVLATGMAPAATATGLSADGYGFLSLVQASPGHLVAGAARGPMDVATTVRDATSAVLRALAVAGGGA
jgi:heterodisulfide reductase subunit A-like polyferredoxin